MKLDVYSTQGKKAGDVTVSDMVFAAKPNRDLVHQVVVSMQSNLRQGSAHTKDRSEVSGTGKKPHQQKGTGRSRHGSRRSPIWRTGGVAFGPRNERNFDKKINRKMRIAALYSALSSKLKSGNVVCVDSLGDMSKPSTKMVDKALNGLQAVAGFETLTHMNPANVTVVFAKATPAMIKSVRNLGYASITDALNINTLNIVNTRYIVIVDPAEVNKIVESRHHTLETVGSNKITAEVSA